MTRLGTHFSQLTQQYKKLNEISFDYSRKFTSILVQNKEDNILLVNGSVKEVVGRCRYVEYKDTLQETVADNFNSIHTVLDEMLDDSMKVLVVAYKPMKKYSSA
ncbi:MAG: hypothetical protein LUF25_07395 [Phascolarctobacterium sp.]|nr:hypothetical protein [Phascolarctobacterium sp.]